MVSKWECSETAEIHQGSLPQERGRPPHSAGFQKRCLVVAAQSRIQAHSCVPTHKPIRVHVHTQESLRHADTEQAWQGLFPSVVLGEHTKGFGGL